MPQPRWSGIPMPAGWPKIRREILERDAGQCQLRLTGCLRTATAVDHIKPAAYGGGHEASNLQAVCEPCHRKKTSADRPRERRGPERHPGLR